MVVVVGGRVGWSCLVLVFANVVFVLAGRGVGGCGFRGGVVGRTAFVVRIPFLLEFPVPTAHGTRLALVLLGVKPLHDAVHVERVVTFTPHRWTIITRNLAFGTASCQGERGEVR